MKVPALCPDCRLRRSRGRRFCPDHFHDFLGWLTALGAESFYWLYALDRGREMYVEAFTLYHDDLVAAQRVLQLDGLAA